MMLTVFRIRAFNAWHDTRGVVLPLTFFILVLLAGLVAALLSVGATETQISANLLRTTQAFNLAEAGAERAIAAFVADSSLVGNAAALTQLFSNQTLGSVGTYTVTYQPMGASTVLVKSTGQSAIGNLTQQVQVVVAVTPQNPFAIVGDDTQISGTGRVIGTGGKAHGNTKMTISADGWVEKTATSTPTTATSCTGCTTPHNVGNVAGSGAGKPSQTLPSASPLDYKPKADFILSDDGWIRVVADPSRDVFCGTASSPGCPAGEFAGWFMNKFSTEPGNWHYNGSGTGTVANPNPPNGMYYASWELSIDSNPGTAANPSSPNYDAAANPWTATLISGDATKRGEMELLGPTPYILPYYQGLLGVGGRVAIEGGGVYGGTVISTTKSRPGVTSHDPLKMSGATLNGQILADGQIQISGTATINYNPAGGGLFSAPQIISWTRLAQ